MMGKADFTYELRGPVVVVVDQEADERGGLSVTNGAEGVVVAKLIADGLDLAGRRVVYDDGDGTWDELRVRDGQFAGFHLLNATSLEDAIHRLGWPGCPTPAGRARQRPRPATLDHGKDSCVILTHRRRLAGSVRHAAAAACGLCTKPL